MEDLQLIIELLNDASCWRHIKVIVHRSMHYFIQGFIVNFGNNIALPIVLVDLSAFTKYFSTHRAHHNVFNDCGHIDELLLRLSVGPVCIDAA